MESNQKSNTTFSYGGALPVGNSTSSPSARINDDSAVLMGVMQRLAGGLGMTFQGQRDMYQMLGYKPQLTPQDYINRYERGDIAERLVEVYPSACWKVTPEVKELTTRGKEKSSTLFAKEFRRLVNRIDPESSEEVNLFDTLYNLDMVLQMGRFAILVLGLEGELDKPLAKGSFSNIDQLGYVKAFGENDVDIVQYETDQKSRRFGQPVLYRVYPNGKGANKDRQSTTATQAQIVINVHWTRVLHVAENAARNALFGKPRLQAVYNKLEDLDKVMGGGAEAFWRNADRGLHANLRDNFEWGKDDKGNSTQDLLNAKLAAYANRWSRGIVTHGVDVNSLGAQVADPQAYLDGIFKLIAATIRVPMRILFGSELGKLASSQDAINWYEQVDARRVNFCSKIIKRLINHLQWLGLLPQTPNGFVVVWPSADPLTEAERIEMQDTRATTALKQANAIAKLMEKLPIMAEPEVLAVIMQQVAVELLQLEGEPLELFIASIKEKIKAGGVNNDQSKAKTITQ